MTNEFITYNGSGIPVNPNQVVVAKLRCGTITKELPASIFGGWSHNYRNLGKSRADIVEYKVVG